MKPLQAVRHLSSIWAYISPVIIHHAMPEPAMIQKFMTQLTAVVALTIMTGMMAGAILIGLIYAGYRFILSQGLEPLAAAGVVSVVALLVTTILALLTMHAMRQMIQIPRMQPMDNSLAGKATMLVNSFLDGLLTPQAHEQEDANTAEQPEQHGSTSFEKARQHA